MNPTLTKCPVCGNDLTITHLHCSRCDTGIEGHFMSPRGSAAPFAQLTPEQLQFLLTFIRCEGRFNRMEEEMKLSYPTLRNRFNEVLRAMGFEPAREEAVARPTAEDRRKILEELDQGKITWAEAQQRLRGKLEESAASTPGKEN